MVEIWLKQIDGDLTIDLRGQTGGKGGKGGNGQFGWSRREMGSE